MHIQIVGKGLDLSDALRERIETRITDGVAKYFNRPGEATIAVTRNNRQFNLRCSLHLPSGAMFQTNGEGGDAYMACDEAMEKMEKRLRRYKRKLKDHGPGRKAAPEPEEFPVRVFESRIDGAAFSDEDEDEDEAAEAEPVIIAESTGELRVMPVGMAVLEMNLSDTPFMLFRNAGHGEVNIVYRRPDGHIGWLDPNRGAKSAS